VQGNYVSGWDDPRMPTICGLRRRGYTPTAIRTFCRTVGLTKVESLSDVALLEHGIREELNKSAPRAMAVLDPVKVVIENYPEGQSESLDAINNPEDAAAGTRGIPFGREFFIEREDFMENPPKGFFRLAPGREVRLRYAYFVTCTGVVKNPVTGAIEEIHCTYDPATRGGDAPDGRKVKATLHWVSAAHAQEVEVRLYDRLFKVERPEDVPEGTDYKANLNPDSFKTILARAEPSLLAAAPETRWQFERKGYFFADPVDSRPGAPVFNQIVPLKDSWGRQQEKPAAPAKKPPRGV
jgi:glutaminyl-tRNA synthetase